MAENDTSRVQIGRFLLLSCLSKGGDTRRSAVPETWWVLDAQGWGGVVDSLSAGAGVQCLTLRRVKRADFVAVLFCRPRCAVFTFVAVTSQAVWTSG